MTTVINLEDIKSIIKDVDLVNAMEEGFIQYSNGNTVVPPVGELLFERPKGDAHIKYGYIKNDDFYVIKIASGFYQNPKLGLSSCQGMMLLFDQRTGVPKAILLDEGYLTDLRTAAAGALAAKYFAAKNIKAIGIIGTGIQAKLQLKYLKEITECKKVWLWGRNKKNVQAYAQELACEYEIHIASTPQEVALHCNLIVTTTPSETALLNADDIQAGTHITAVGSDTSNKQELASALLHKADLVIADSIPQSQSRGEVYRAVKDGAINAEKVIELGAAIQQAESHRTNEQQITIADLTGVAVQDIMIATAVYKNFLLDNQS
jgi:ornithine cyclodeaminase